MGLTPKIRKVVIGATVAATAAALTGVVIASAPSSSAATACGVLFDDFNYSSPSDPALGQRGWSLRGNAGGPGVPGASWSANNISFPTVDGQRVAQMKASTNGTAAGTSMAEFSQSNRRFFEGTYLSRIKFSDAPVSGPDGDTVNQTFYTISPLEGYRDPTYSELDFMEYLPNGGWDGPQAGYETTWYTYTAEPWYKDGLSGQQNRSYAGWHDIMATVANGQVTYYVDGAVVATHGGKYYPRKNMSIDFNQWFIDLTGHQGAGTSVWQQSIDYVYHAKKQVLTPAQASAAVNAYRSAGTAHTDNVVTANDCAPGTPPVVTQPPATTKPPVTTPPVTNPPTTTRPPTTTAPPVTTAPPTGGTTWAAYTTYSVGQIVTYNGVRYQCRQSHVAYPGWEPPNVLALWLPI
jgi:hypothetical protein